jgi:hypothetical protein
MKIRERAIGIERSNAHLVDFRGTFGMGTCRKPGWKSARAKAVDDEHDVAL